MHRIRDHKVFMNYNKIMRAEEFLMDFFFNADVDSIVFSNFFISYVI